MPRISVSTSKSQQYSAEIDQGAALSDALRGLAMPCGGRHTCGKCAVQVAGDCEPMSASEDLLLRMMHRSAPLAGYTWRLACTCVSLGDCDVYIEENTSGLQVAGMAQLAIEPNLLAGFQYGVAVDIGTTTISAVLYDVCTGAQVAAEHALNEQSRFGADVLSRIEHARAHGVELLSQCVAAQIGRMTGSILERAGIRAGDVGEIVITGNTTMLHCLAGLDPSSIGVAPFDVVSYFGENYQLWSQRCFLPRCISAYVGADITCGILALGMDESIKPVLMVDIGTNGEMALCNLGAITCCATAAGPAFEGAEIDMGMTATDGAVSGIALVDGVPVPSVIGGGRAIGVCGTGIIGAISFMIEHGMIESNGRIRRGGHAFERFVIDIGGELAFRLGDTDVHLTQRDIRNVQLAKAAIRAGIETLMHRAGLKYAELGALYISGGFGNYIDPVEAARVGLIPEQLAAKSDARGNTALHGAALMLGSASNRARQDDIARAAMEIQLASDAYFMDQYIEQMAFYEE